MRVAIRPEHPNWSFREIDADRSGYATYFGEILNADPRMRGTVLEIGCGEAPNKLAPLGNALKLAKELHGVDPNPDGVKHPLLKKFFHGFFEDQPVPSEHYDAMVGYYVVEHVGKPQEFMKACHRVLKPGGVLYTITPNLWHPFALIVLIFEVTGLKGFYAKHVFKEDGINKIPTYYRLNSRGGVLKAAKAAGFETAEFHHFPCTQWDHYFPKFLRFLPHLYDRILGIRSRFLAQQLIIKLEKPGTWAGEAAQNIPKANVA